MKDLVNDYFDGNITTMTAQDFGNITKIRTRAFSRDVSSTNVTNPATLTNIEFPNTLKIIEAFSFIGHNPSSLIIPDNVIDIGKSAFLNSPPTTITIGKSVNKIDGSAFAIRLGNPSLTEITFRQPAGMTISLPTAGSGNGMFYSKKAYEITIYTDNETIKNYDWAKDNVTATFKHLDGSDWA